MKKTAEEIYIESVCNSKKDIIEAMELYKTHHTAPLIEALEKATILLKKLDLRQRPSNNAISAIDRTIKQAETALLNAKGL